MKYIKLTFIVYAILMFFHFNPSDFFAEYGEGIVIIGINCLTVWAICIFLKWYFKLITKAQQKKEFLLKNNTLEKISWPTDLV